MFTCSSGGKTTFCNTPPKKTFYEKMKKQYEKCCSGIWCLYNVDHVGINKYKAVNSAACPALIFVRINGKKEENKICSIF